MSTAEQPGPAPTDPAQASASPRWLRIAEGELGIHETPGPVATSRIVLYHSATTLHATSDEVPWCASFVSWCLERAGVPSTRSAAARSYLEWGRSLSLTEPLRWRAPAGSPAEPALGAVAVFRRGDNEAQGHVAFFLGYEGKLARVLGGNQADKVSIAHYVTSDLLALRWPA